MEKVKNILKLLWNEFVYGGHLISLGAVSVVFTSAILLHIKITWDCLVVVYLGAQAVYLYYQFQDIERDFLTNPERCQHVKKYIKIIPLMTTCFILISLGILFYFNKFSNLVFYFLVVSLSLLYNKFLKKITKKVVAFKNFLISLAQTLSVVFLAIYYSFEANLSLLLILIFVYLRWFTNTAFLDLKDVRTDKKEGLLTLPIVLKGEGLMNILSLTTILSVIPIIYGFYLKVFPPSSLMLLLTVPYSFYYFGKLKKKEVNTNFLYNVLVNGEFIFWTFFVALGELLL